MDENKNINIPKENNLNGEENIANNTASNPAQNFEMSENIDQVNGYEYTADAMGPMSPSPTPPMPQDQGFNNTPQGIKPPKPPKNKGSKGVKAFAVVMCILFVITAISFVIYAVSVSKNDVPKQDGNTQSAPTLDISDTPDNNQTNADGTLTTKEIYKKVSPSVVGIAVYTQSNTTSSALAGQGSGIIMTSDGYIVTNHHVVSSDDAKITKIEVILNDGTTYDARIIGTDSSTDLGVIKINATGLTVAEFGDSDKLSVGDRVIVIGNPSGIQYAGSLTQGVVSALNRKVYMSQLGATMQYIQTDAAINPGNSGGAFINEYGQVVGISSAKMIQEGYEGMGFAIPINNAKSIIDSLIKNGYVAGRPKIGITYVPVSQTLSNLNGIPVGLRVWEVEESSDAYKKGLKKGDIITKMDDNAVYDADSVSEVLKSKKPGDSVKLTIYRVDDNGKSNTIEMSVLLSENIPDTLQ